MTQAITPNHQVTYDGASVNVYHANKGEGLPRHEHAYAHLTMCHSGSCVIRKVVPVEVCEPPPPPPKLKVK